MPDFLPLDDFEKLDATYMLLRDLIQAGENPDRWRPVLAALHIAMAGVHPEPKKEAS